MKQKFRTHFILSTLFILSACTNQPAGPSATVPQNTSASSASGKTPGSCLCATLWLPVCGENQKTYSNACYAKCARVAFTQGTCQEVITK